MRNYIITIYCYDGLLECIYQGDIYGPMMSTVVYVVYIVFTLFPDAPNGQCKTSGGSRCVCVSSPGMYFLFI